MSLARIVLGESSLPHFETLSPSRQLSYIREVIGGRMPQHYTGNTFVNEWNLESRYANLLTYAQDLKQPTTSEDRQTLDRCVEDIQHHLNGYLGEIVEREDRALSQKDVWRVMATLQRKKTTENAPLPQQKNASEPSEDYEETIPPRERSRKAYHLKDRAMGVLGALAGTMLALGVASGVKKAQDHITSPTATVRFMEAASMIDRGINETKKHLSSLMPRHDLPERSLEHKVSKHLNTERYSRSVAVLDKSYDTERIITNQTAPHHLYNDPLIFDIKEDEHVIAIDKATQSELIYRFDDGDYHFVEANTISTGRNKGQKERAWDYRTPHNERGEYFSISEVVDTSDWIRHGRRQYGPWGLRLDTGSWDRNGTHDPLATSSYLLHGTDSIGEQSLGERASEGCVRHNNEDIARIKESYLPAKVVISERFTFTEHVLAQKDEVVPAPGLEPGTSRYRLTPVHP